VSEGGVLDVIESHFKSKPEGPRRPDQCSAHVMNLDELPRHS
jgi:hypothetical protein